jgi:hypothetical protein
LPLRPKRPFNPASQVNLSQRNLKAAIRPTQSGTYPCRSKCAFGW